MPFIKNIELTESGIDKFNAFFAKNAKKTLSYEFHRQFTKTGRPEILDFDISDVLITECDEDGQ